MSPIKNTSNEPKRTGMYAINNSFWFNYSGCLLVSKNGAKKIRNTLNGGGSDINKLYFLSA